MFSLGAPDSCAFHRFVIFFFRMIFEGIEHYGVITDITAIFKVTDTDTCLFVMISYSKSVFSVVDRIE